MPELNLVQAINQGLAQAMQAEDGTLLPGGLFPAGQKNDRVKNQQQTGPQQP